MSDNSLPTGPRSAIRVPAVQARWEDVHDRLARRAGHLVTIQCPLCGRVGRPAPFDRDLRESGRCRGCGASNRQRQVAFLVARALTPSARRPTVAGVADGCGKTIYNTETSGPLHEVLHHLPSYVGSEYLGPDVEPGTVVDGVRHEDLRDLSFDDGSVDLVISSDVLEHVPDPYRAHEEIYRVLADGGRHVFTVPFHGMGYHDEVRARMVGSDIEYLEPPVYHDDPVRLDEGVLVFTIFGLEMLLRLRQIGFVTYLYKLRSLRSGIVGDNALVFEAVKADWGWR